MHVVAERERRFAAIATLVRAHLALAHSGLINNGRSSRASVEKNSWPLSVRHPTIAVRENGAPWDKRQSRWLRTADGFAVFGDGRVSPRPKDS
jgi:hypothetical protein